jgi:2-polyprenyl-3-methyl-5-hydroxy-6-metoxy-1,4-benzoquinol methylase
MNADSIESKRRQVVERFGPWSAHNIRLTDDVYTMGKGIVGDEIKLRRVLQSVADVSGKPLANLRILDLACLEGLYAVEFARHGAQVVGLEGRTVNLAKARFAKEVLGLENLELLQDDVRNLSRAKYGVFDVVLCLGILYHLDAPDVFYFLEQIAEVCQSFAVIDTHISLTPEQSYLHREREYWGRVYAEHEVNATAEEKAERLWASLDNPKSFWLTRPSLYNVLTQVGFTSVYECHLPPEAVKPEDRLTLVAIRGKRQSLFGSPLLSGQATETLVENEDPRWSSRT